MKKVLFFLTTFFILSVSFSVYVSADNIGVEVTNIKQELDFISIEWNDVGDSYNVYRDDELLVKTSENKINDNNLEPSSIYTYLIEVIDKTDKTIDVIKVQTQTKFPETKSLATNNDQHILRELPITTIVREGEVSLDWGKIEGVDKYNIYRNEKLIASVNDSEYKDSSFNPDENYIYTIKASREVSENEYNTSLEELKKYNLSPTEKELEQLKYQEIERNRCGLRSFIK